MAGPMPRHFACFMTSVCKSGFFCAPEARLMSSSKMEKNARMAARLDAKCIKMQYPFYIYQRKPVALVLTYCSLRRHHFPMNKRKTVIPVGESAPDFTATASDGATVQLSALRGQQRSEEHTSE